MLNDASGFKHIYLCTGYTDLRRGIDGLIAVVNAGFKLDPRESGSIFLFCGRRCDRIKTLLYEGDGWLLCYKRFTDGKLQWPRSTGEARTLTPQQYRWLMDGQVYLPFTPFTNKGALVKDLRYYSICCISNKIIFFLNDN